MNWIKKNKWWIIGVSIAIIYAIIMQVKEHRDRVQEFEAEYGPIDDIVLEEENKEKQASINNQKGGGLGLDRRANIRLATNERKIQEVTDQNALLGKQLRDIRKVVREEFSTSLKSEKLKTEKLEDVIDTLVQEKKLQEEKDKMKMRTIENRFKSMENLLKANRRGGGEFIDDENEDVITSREHKVLPWKTTDDKGIGNAEDFLTEEVIDQTLDHVALVPGMKCWAELEHPLAIQVGEKDRVATFLITSPFQGIRNHEIEFTGMKIQGVCEAKMDSEGTGRVIIELRTLSVILDTGEIITKPIEGYVTTETKSGDLEGKNITKIGIPLLKKFFLNTGAGMASGYGSAQGETVTSGSGDFAATNTSESQAFKKGLGEGFSQGAQDVVDTYDKFHGELLPTVSIPKETEVRIYLTKQVLFEELTLDREEVNELSQLY